jgi:hypothetical protein
VLLQPGTWTNGPLERPRKKLHLKQIPESEIYLLNISKWCLHKMNYLKTGMWSQMPFLSCKGVGMIWGSTYLEKEPSHWTLSLQAVCHYKHPEIKRCWAKCQVDEKNCGRPEESLSIGSIPDSERKEASHLLYRSGGILEMQRRPCLHMNRGLCKKHAFTVRVRNCNGPVEWKAAEMFCLTKQ